MALKSTQRLLSERLDTLKRRQDGRRAYLRKIEEVIKRRDLEIHNLELQLKECS